jgi:hypothetical protein
MNANLSVIITFDERASVYTAITTEWEAVVF